MQSMTGYGRCRACCDGREMTVELKTVNHRFLDLSFRLPKNLAFLEDALRLRINGSGLRRGHVDVFLTYQNTRADARAVRIDVALLEAFNAALRQAEKELEPYKRPTVSDILELSGAVTVSQAEEDAEAVTALALEAFDGALEQLCDMRAREGVHLADDLLRNLDGLSALREHIASRAPMAPEEYRKRLEARLEEWSVSPADPQRLAQEVALLADRCAIDEELSRLQSHIDQFRQSLHGTDEAGRRLDFLLQEMNREVNTMGAKASDAQIAQSVVDAKCVIEKLREQVQNVV